MRARLGVGAVVVTATAMTLGLGTLSPAYAEPPAVPTITVDPVSVPGHVTGTVTSGDAQPFAFVRLASNVPATLVTMTPPAIEGDPSTGTFDLETWGYGNPTVTVQGVACTTATPTSNPNDDECSSVATSDSFTPTDLTPQVTWFEDDTIGPGQQASVTVSDPGGGGTLHAIFVNSENANTDTVLVPDVPTALDLEEGVGLVRITRCATANAFNCSDTGFTGTPITKNIEVRRTMTATVGAADGPVGPTDQTATVDVTTSRNGTYSMSWHLELPAEPGVSIPGTGGSRPAGTPLASGVAVDVPVGGILLPGGTIAIVGTITVVDPEFGTYTNVPMTGGTIFSDRVGPTVTSYGRSATTIYPKVATAKRPGTAKIRVNPAGPDVTSIQIATPSGKVFRILPTASDDTATWDGKNSAGVLVPANTYTVRARDPLGNPSGLATSIKVDTRVLVIKTWRKTVTPADSDIAKFVGVCSTLKRPSNRGWVGSFGFYANTTCATQTFNASAVSTVHKTSLPKADAYVDFHVDTYGGAATTLPTSVAVVRYMNKSGNWATERVLNRSLVLHPGPTVSTATSILPDGSLRWGMVTAYNNRYDVARFTIVLRYKTLG